MPFRSSANLRTQDQVVQLAIQDCSVPLVASAHLPGCDESEKHLGTSPLLVPREVPRGSHSNTMSSLLVGFPQGLVRDCAETAVIPPVRSIP
jgi:hypothetical protein